MADTPNKSELLELAAEIVAAHVANNKVAVGDLPGRVQLPRRLERHQRQRDATARRKVAARFPVRPGHARNLGRSRRSARRISRDRSRSPAGPP